MIWVQISGKATFFFFSIILFGQVHPIIVLKVTKFGEDQLNCFWDFNRSDTKCFGNHMGYQGVGPTPPPSILWLPWSKSVKFLSGIGASLNVLYKVKLIEYLLFRHRRNHSITWCFSWLFPKNVIENSLFTVVYRNCNFQFIKMKLFEAIALFNTYWEK